MNTSYFAISSLLPNAVSIALKAPRFYRGRVYRALAPTSDILNEYRVGGNVDIYITRYIDEVLGILDPKQVYEELGEDAILLCWEGRDKFCHRRLVAEWFEHALKIEVPEL